MRRYFESLRPADRSAIDSVPDGLFLVRVERARYRWHAQKPYYLLGFAVLEPKHPGRVFDHWPPLLHAQGNVEIQLVPARLRIRHRAAG